MAGDWAVRFGRPADPTDTGMRVGFYDPYQPAGFELTVGWERVSSLRDLAVADVLILHCPATPETADMVDSRYWSQVWRRGPRSGQVLLNTARGSIVRWADFRAAFDAGVVRCAGLDVLATEPLDVSDDLIARWRSGDPEVRRRLLITPHAAFLCPAALADLEHGAANTLIRLLEAAVGPGGDRARGGLRAVAATTAPAGRRAQRTCLF